ncbi:MAG: molybdenum cofactor biosynthesis protein B [Acidobacteriota bacterium]
MSIEQHKGAAATPFGVAVVAVTDSRSPQDDRNTPLVSELAIAAGHRVAVAKLLPNAVSAVQEELQDLLGRDDVDVVIFCGGTGFSPKDLTVDAVRPFLEHEVEGFGELFRALSYVEIGTSAMLSRALGGVARRRAVFCLPGSPNAVKLAVERLILPELSHLLGQMRRDG